MNSSVSNAADPAGIRTQGPNIYKYTFLLFLNVNLRCTEV